MAMQVETFEQTEVDCDGTVEKDAEVLALISSLALEGQGKLLSVDGKKRVPYREMSKREVFVYSQVFPSKEPAHQYQAGPIPLRALQVLAHAHDLVIFKKLEVWHNANLKDPVLVAFKEPYGSIPFILARWGEALVPFAELEKLACNMARAKFGAKLKGIAQQVKADLEKLVEFDDAELAAVLEVSNEPYYREL